MLTKGRREYQIDIFNLSNQLHEFEFAIDDALLSMTENSALTRGKGNCKLLMQKSETMMTLHFSIAVEVGLTCDRSLDSYSYPMNIEEDYIIKFGEVDDDSHEEYTIIRKDTPSIYVDSLIYEFISLAVPMKKLHPRYEGQETPDLIYSTKISDEEEKTEEVADPRWEALKKLKDK
ncbi:MAG: DUF177 domain-containing protein [Cyclobacteriaceae bacterium]